MGASPTSVGNRNRKKYALTFLTLIILLCSGAKSSGQYHWSKVTTPIGGQITPYFLNENLGFIFLYGQLRPLYRTTDGGVTWNISFNVARSTTTRIFFNSASHGFLLTTTGVYETKDTGITWQPFYTQAAITSIYAADDIIIATVANS